MLESDKRLIEALNKIFSSHKGSVKFKTEEFDDEFWEESLALGYSEGTAVESVDSKVTEAAIEEIANIQEKGLDPELAELILNEDKKSEGDVFSGTAESETLEIEPSSKVEASKREVVAEIPLQSGVPIKLRGVFEGSFIPVEFEL